MGSAFSGATMDGRAGVVVVLITGSIIRTKNPIGTIRPTHRGDRSHMIPDYLLCIQYDKCVENKRADARRDGRTRLARLNSQTRTGSGKNIFPVQPTTSTIGNHTRLIQTLLHVVLTIYIYTYNIPQNMVL